MESKKAQFMSSWLGKMVFAMIILVVLIAILMLVKGKLGTQIGRLGNLLRFG